MASMSNVYTLSNKKQNILPTQWISLAEESPSSKSPELLYTILMQYKSSCDGEVETIRSYVHSKEFYTNLSEKIEDEKMKLKMEIEQAKIKKCRHCLSSCIRAHIIVRQKEKKLRYLDSGKGIYTLYKYLLNESDKAKRGVDDTSSVGSCDGTEITEKSIADTCYPH